ncbi:glycosyltransferase [Candidatus Microgenomates bacterium]|nr:glycosyltransferase [Candidatus Microgenomates bacterium]
MERPYFSIIIPCLNEEKYLPKLLNNLTKQSFSDFEVIVVDGNSSDKTVKEANKFKKKLNLKIISTDIRNVSFQRNLGAKNSKADILIFFDADTKIPKTFLKKIYQTFENENPDCVNSWVKTTSKLETDKAIAVGTNALFELSKFFGIPASIGAFIAIKKSVFNKIRGFNQNLKFAEDSDLTQKVVKHNFNYIILRSTYYYYSLRRYKKEGTINTLRKSAVLNLNRALNLEKFIKVPEYKMGGQVFDTKDKNSLLWINKTFENIKTNYNKDKIKGNKFFTSLLKELKTK